MTEFDQHELAEAHRLLNNPSLATKIASLVPIEEGMKRLPYGAQRRVIDITESALKTSLKAALFTIKDDPKKEQRNLIHKSSVAISGALGGAFGLPAIALELPISTTIMLRSIADIARSQGESVSDPNTISECISVFALGGSTKSDDNAEIGYFGIRSILAYQVSAAGQFIAKELAKKTSERLALCSGPNVVKLINDVASRFGVEITHKLAAQLVPAIGAAGGATFNWLFLSHYQDMARGHFTIRRLERTYGQELIGQEYNKLSIEL